MQPAGSINMDDDRADAESISSRNSRRDERQTTAAISWGDMQHRRRMHTPHQVEPSRTVRTPLTRITHLRLFMVSAETAAWRTAFQVAFSAADRMLECCGLVKISNIL